MLLSAILYATTAYGGLVTISAPTFDRWNYPFNVSPGSRSVGSTFSSYNSGYDFDNRDGQVLVAWQTDGVVEPGWPASAYTVLACTVTIAIASDDITYDPTADDPATHEDGGPADADAGRPVLLSGVGFRNGWTPWTWADDGPFGPAMTSGTRNCFAADLDDAGQLRDISNSLAMGLVPNGFAFGTSDVAALGELLPQYSTLTFAVNVDDPDIQCYLRTGFADGLTEFMVTSLHPATMPGSGDPGISPDWILSEHALVGMGLVDAATITLDVSLNEPSGVIADVDGDGSVGVNDLLHILADYGACPCCPSDLDGDGLVTVDDLLTLIGAWAG